MSCLYACISYKELLELEFITNKQYQKLKEELTPVIIN